MFGKLALRIKRKETPFFALLHKLAKCLYTMNFPVIKLLHFPLYYLNFWTKAIFTHILHTFWSVPLFKARCECAGRNLLLPNGVPLVLGSHLRILLGDDVTIGRSTIGASKVFDQPILKIGNNTVISFGTTISVAKEVNIGDNCLISGFCLIMDSDDHPLDPFKRLAGLPVDREEVKPVRIGSNVWIGAYVCVLKGVTIGDNSIIATHSVVTHDVERDCIYAGNPAKMIKRISVE